MRSLKDLTPSSKKMKIISVLLSLLLFASANEAMAEHWELVEKGITSNYTATAITITRIKKTDSSIGDSNTYSMMEAPLSKDMK